MLKYELGKEINGDKVTKIKCKVCIKHEQNIGMKGFSKLRLNSTASVKKDVKGVLKSRCLAKHVMEDPLVQKGKNKNLGQIFTIKRWFLLHQ